MIALTFNADGSEQIDTGVVCLDGEEMIIENAKGFGQKDLSLFGYYVNWTELTEIETAIKLARKTWEVQNE